MEQLRNLGRNLLNRLSKEPQDQDANRKAVLVSSKSQFPAMSKHRTFLDEAELEVEEKRLAQAGSDTLKQLPSPIPLYSENEVRRWTALHGKMNDLLDISSIYGQKLKDIELYGGDPLRIAVLHSGSAGIALVIVDTLRSQMRMAERNGFAHRLKPFEEITRFALTPDLGINIGGITLEDFIRYDKRTRVIPHYAFLLTGSLVGELGLYDEILSAQTPIYLEYPNSSKRVIDILPNRIRFLSYLQDGSDFIDATRNNPPILKEASIKADLLIKGIQEVRGTTYRTILEPSSAEHEPLKNFLRPYLFGDKSVAFLCLLLLGLDRPESITDFYRSSRKLSFTRSSDPFYRKLVEVTEEFVEEASAPISSLLTKDDISGVLDQETTPASHSEGIDVILGNFARQVSTIFSRSGQLTYEVAGDVVWNPLTPPQSAQIEFDPSRPRKFKLSIKYGNELGEETSISLTVDSSNHFVDWNFIEDPMLPENEEVQSLRDNLLAATARILSYIESTTKTSSKITAETTQDTKVAKRRKRERYEDPVYKLRREVRASAKQTHASQYGSVRVEFSPESYAIERSIRNEVKLPKKEDIDELLKALSHEDRRIIVAAINEYNQRGTGGKFSRKKLLVQGEPRYTLSIGCSVPKGARVLLRETASEEGIRRFEIVDIRYRKNIYPKNKL